MQTTEAAVDFATVFEKAPWPAVVLDRDFIIIACNAAYESAADLGRSLMLGRRVFDVFPGHDPSERELLISSFQQVLETGKPHYIPVNRYSLGHPDEGFEERYWTVTSVPLPGKEGGPHFILHCPLEITGLEGLRSFHQGRSGSEKNDDGEAHSWAQGVRNVLSAEREWLQQLFKQAPGFICVLRGPDHVYELANDAYYQLIGHRQIIGHALADVLPEVISQGFLEKLDHVYATGEVFIGRAMPIQLQRVPEGELEQRFIDLIYQPIRDGKDEMAGIFVQGHDVTETYELAREVAYQAAHDPLTGLPNRREFARQTQAIEGTGPHSLVYMDVDHFKIVNDRCGHAAGDALLLLVSQAIKEQCAETDLLARLGGDEFALIRQNSRTDEAVALADRLRSAVRNLNFFWEGKRYSVTLSIGVVSFGDKESLSFGAALGLADSACFLAKEKGRNRVQVGLPSDEDIRQQQHDMDNATYLKEALREDRVILYVQKIVPLQPGPREARSLFEVLARLKSSEGAIICPSSFIPAAERFGLIEELDRHVVTKIFARLESQADAPEEICYFINLSGTTLSAPGFFSFVEAALARYPAVRPSQVCFEVTETAAISNVARTAEAMRRLIEKGFSFALDDFGSGMASFTYLHHLPVQFVKIDGEFVKAVLTHPSGEVIVEAVAKVARTMDMFTIAESVELDESLPHLRRLGVDFGQGFALHAPEPI